MSSPKSALPRLDVTHLPPYPRPAPRSAAPKFLAVDNDKALPDAPDLLTPLRKHQPSPMFNNQSRWSWSNRKGRVLTFQQPTEPTDGRPRWVFTFPALVISLLAFIMATLFLVYLVALRRVQRPDAQWAIFVFEPMGSPLLGLTITTVATHVVSISVPFLISVAGYCVAGKWLAEQQFPPAARPALPTPLQYASMVKMLTTSKVTSVYEAGRYMKAAKGNIRFPRTFHVALALTSLVMGLSYLLILVDIWLHGSAFVVYGSIPSTSSQKPIQNTSFGVAFNESICSTSPFCLQGAAAGGGYGASWITQAGLVIASNSSDGLSVITLNNASDLAVVVSKPVNPFVAFEAPSFGIKAQCISLTASCNGTTGTPPIECSAFPLIGSPTSVSASASVRGSSSTASAAARPSATSSQTGVTKLVLSKPTTSNPQTVLMQLQWNANGSMVSQNPAAVETADGDILAWASCELTFYNVTLRHEDGVFGIVGEPVLASADFSNIMQRGLLSQLGNIRLLSNLQTTMLAEQNTSSAVGAMNQELGRVALALFTGTLQPAPLSQSNTQDSQPALLGRYPLVPVVLYLFLLYAYSLTAAFIYVWAARLRSQLFRNPNGKTTCAVQLAQLRLTDPLTLVAALYPSYPDNPTPEDPRELFMEETAVRLAISTHDGPQPMFGVYQRTGTWTLEMGE